MVSMLEDALPAQGGSSGHATPAAGSLLLPLSF